MMFKKIIKNLKNFFLKKENKISVDFDKATLELRKSDKYYISFRILNRWGFYFQGINCLLFSIETLLKISLYPKHKRLY